MKLPNLNYSGRRREYNEWSYDQIAEITYAWLFKNNLGHRELDKEILNIDPLKSKGFQSMNVLHFLGLKNNFKGFFNGYDFNEAIKILKEDKQDFTFVIELLTSALDETKNAFEDELYKEGKSKDTNFDQNYLYRLSELDSTDRDNKHSKSRKEQALFRAILFKSKKEAQCAICHRLIPTNLMVAAHIKPRSKCNPNERKNINVVMPLCKIGCDDLFEKGYIVVDEEGIVRTNYKIRYSKAMKFILNNLIGNSCKFFNNKTISFFEYRKQLIEN